MPCQQPPCGTTTKNKSDHHNRQCRDQFVAPEELLCSRSPFARSLPPSPAQSTSAAVHFWPANVCYCYGIRFFSPNKFPIVAGQILILRAIHFRKNEPQHTRRRCSVVVHHVRQALLKNYNPWDDRVKGRGTRNMKREWMDFVYCCHSANSFHSSRLVSRLPPQQLTLVSLGHADRAGGMDRLD